MHKQILGSSGRGKGVFACLSAAQCLRNGDAVICIDPKSDEWAPHILRDESNKAEKPFFYVDLRVDGYQLDLLEGATSQEISEMFINAFSMSDKGTDADFYRQKDRRAARDVASKYQSGDTVQSLFSKYGCNCEEDAPSLYESLAEVSLVDGVSGKGGVSLIDLINTGGCLYVVGSTDSPSIKKAQKMLLIRIIQIAKKRDRITDDFIPVCLYLDEIKYQISPPVVEALGTIRDKGVHMTIVHQALDDLRDCPGVVRPEFSRHFLFA